MNDDLITTRAAAALLGVGTTSIKRWADDGTLVCVRTAGGHRRFRRGEVLRLLNSSEEGPGSESKADIHERLPSMTTGQLDTLDFGVVQLGDDGLVLQYNAFEEEFAHLRRQDVAGLNFFTHVAPCTNNKLLYGRFREGVARGLFDFTMDYTFTYKMQPRVVSLHVFRHSGTNTNWLLVRPR
ncbi:MAG: helix-turn-helix domain-containing protein [Deltaproteobacteria bacterium]|nr:helix-turn-helix domain-containing protein [Deltaproteobacteria bacterium]